jgi:LmbE family N-acetylglucosaminyl deacetylase
MATVVAFHAHPDDEAVLTGGTLARAAAAGHRVVIVTATDGRMGNELDRTRMNELRSSAEILGASRVECLGYADSGYGPISMTILLGGSGLHEPVSTNRRTN